MNSVPSKLFSIACLALALPMLGLSANVGITIGSLAVCVNNSNCANPTPVTFGNTQTGSTSSSITAASNDVYSVATNYSVGYNASGTSIFFNPTVTYAGSMPSTVGNAVQVDLYAKIYDPSVSNWNGNYTEHVPLSIGNNTLAAANLFVDGQGVGLVGIFGAGNYDVTKTTALTGLDGNYLNYDYRFIFNFLPGTATGTCDSGDPDVSCYGSVAPEPAETIPAALTLAGFALVALRRRKK